MSVDYDTGRHYGVQLAVSKLRAHIQDREQQAAVLDDRKGTLPITLAMSEVVRLKKEEAVKCLAIVEALL